MIVDDADVFDVPPAPPSKPLYAKVPATRNSAQAQAYTHSIDLVSKMARETAQEMEENIPIDDVLGLLDRDGHRARAGYLTPGEGVQAHWAQHPMPGEPIGSHALSFPGAPLSPPCRDRMLQSLEHDAPALILNELRSLARSDAHTGVSAWRAVRERERTHAGKPANRAHADKL